MRWMTVPILVSSCFLAGCKDQPRDPIELAARLSDLPIDDRFRVLEFDDRFYVNGTLNDEGTVSIRLALDSAQANAVLEAVRQNRGYRPFPAGARDKDIMGLHLPPSDSGFYMLERGEHVGNISYVIVSTSDSSVRIFRAKGTGVF